MIGRRQILGLLTGLALLSGPPARAAGAPVILAAASLQEALTEAANQWAVKGHPKPVLSFASSALLARQLEAGAPADLFISADEAWMDYVAGKGLIKPASRRVFLGNRLVLVAPADRPLRLKIAKGFPLARALGDGRLAMADPASVPAGKYGKAALIFLGVWPSVEAKVARGDNVRAALAFVERGEARAAVVYETDARVSPRVVVAGVFPAASHGPIRYPLALTAGSRNPEAAGFRAFLLSAAGRTIFLRHGFSAP